MGLMRLIFLLFTLCLYGCGSLAARDLASLEPTVVKWPRCLSPDGLYSVEITAAENPISKYARIVQLQSKDYHGKAFDIYTISSRPPYVGTGVDGKTQTFKLKLEKEDSQDFSEAELNAEFVDQRTAEDGSPISARVLKLFYEHMNCEFLEP